MPPNQRYRIPSRVSTRTLLSAVAEESKVVAGPQVGLLREYLDTADWRAQGRGWQVELDRSTRPGRGVMLTLRDRETESVIASAARDWAPLYGTDLPKRQPWSELSDVIEGRRLLVQAEASVGSQVASVVNQDDKTTVRIYLERVTLSGPAGRHRVLRTAAVAAVRGYERSRNEFVGCWTHLVCSIATRRSWSWLSKPSGGRAQVLLPDPECFSTGPSLLTGRWPSCLLACASTW